MKKLTIESGSVFDYKESDTDQDELEEPFPDSKEEEDVSSVN
jgi:hypothetical protein